MIAPGPIVRVCVMLTARCDLQCSYCYQNVRRRGRMSWRTLRESIDLLRSSPRRDVELVFLGGEPLLEYDLLRRGIAYAKERLPPRQRLRTSLLTNGMLITDEVARFLADEGVDTQLSFDGVRAAQDARQKGTFDRLDLLLDRLRERRPGFFHDRLTVAAALTPGNVRHFADSFDYFLDKGVRRVIPSPVITPTPEWRLPDIEELDRQFSQVARSALRRLERTGHTPLALPGDGAPTAAERSGTAMCGIGSNDSPVVDVDGQVYACAAFAASTVLPSNALVEEASRTTRIARLTDPDFADRFRAVPAAVARSPVFTHKERKRSGYRSCAACPHLDACRVCPAAVARGGEDPDRVPDFACAFNLVSLGRAALPAAGGPRDRIRSGPARRLPVESDRTLSAGRPPSQGRTHDT